MGLPLPSTFGGIRPLLDVGVCSGAIAFAGAGKAAFPSFCTSVADTLTVMVERCPEALDGVTATAISPGRMTRKGKNILGSAAISGVRRAALIESAAMARCTTRKSVHQ